MGKTARTMILAQKAALGALVVLSLGAGSFAYVSLEASVLLMSLALLTLGGLIYLSTRNLVHSVRTVVRQEDQAVKSRDALVKEQLSDLKQATQRIEQGLGKTAANVSGAIPKSKTGPGHGDEELILDVYSELRSVQNAISSLRAEQAGMRQELISTKDKLVQNEESRLLQR